MKAIPLVQLMVRDGTMIFFFVTGESSFSESHCLLSAHIPRTVFLLVVVIYTFRQHPYGVVALAYVVISFTPDLMKTECTDGC